MRLNGQDFHVEVDGRGEPLLLLHGFTGSVRAWDLVRPALASFATVIAVDLLGHGRSAVPAEAGRYSLDWCTRDLNALLDGLELDLVDVLGYSMGGRAALHFALHSLPRVTTLILESASPGIDDQLERERRVDSDAALAGRAVEHGIGPFVAEWERLPLLAVADHVPQSERAQHTAQRLRNTPLGLANSLLGMGAGQQTPVWDRLPELSQPVQLIVGERDTRYRRIAARMHAALPNCQMAVVAGAGHTVHVDDPHAFVGLVEHALRGGKAAC